MTVTETADDILVITDTPAPANTPARAGRKLPAPHFCADRLFSLAEYLKWQYGLEDDAKLCRHAAIEIKCLRQAIREAHQGAKAIKEEIKRLKDEVARLEEMWRAAEFDGEPI
jgi:septal ring factor EnvC (AmiA/AmiB activator)